MIACLQMFKTLTIQMSQNLFLSLDQILYRSLFPRIFPSSLKFSWTIFSSSFNEILFYSLFSKKFIFLLGSNVTLSPNVANKKELGSFRIGLEVKEKILLKILIKLREISGSIQKRNLKLVLILQLRHLLFLINFSCFVFLCMCVEELWCIIHQILTNKC